MSLFIDNMIALLPSATSAAANFGAANQAIKTARASADRLRAIGEIDSRLRALQAVELLGGIQASIPGRNLVGAGGTGDEQEFIAAQLEGRDIELVKFRFDSLAEQTEQRGEATRNVGIIRGIGDIFNFGRAQHLQGRISSIEGNLLEILENQKRITSSPTVLTGRPNVLDIGAFGPQRNRKITAPPGTPRTAPSVTSIGDSFRTGA